MTCPKFQQKIDRSAGAEIFFSGPEKADFGKSSKIRFFLFWDDFSTN